MAETFDVFVEGGKDTSPAGMAGLATAIAARYKMPPEAVASAVAKGRFRVGKGLDKATAERLAKQLGDLGALTVTAPTGGTPSLHPDTGESPKHKKTIAGVPPPPAIRLGFLDSSGQTGSGAAVADEFSAQTEIDNPRARAAAARSAATPAPRAIGRVAPAPARDPFTPPDMADEAPLELAGPTTTKAPAQSSERGFAPMMNEAPLELDLPQPKGPNPADVRLPSQSGGHGSDPAASGERPAEGRPSAARPLLNDPDLPEGNPNIVRCQTHGLMYDRGKTHGCRKCLEPPRAHASLGAKKPILTLADLKHDVAKRAFVGLAVALFIGFLPTAWYVWGVNDGDVIKLRAAQAEVSKRPGTTEVLKEFDKFDSDIDSVRSRGAFKAFFLWVILSGAAMGGWYKATDRFVV